jgi:hypothetical protein
LEAPKYIGNPPSEESVESVMRIASTSGNSFGIILFVVLLLLLLLLLTSDTEVAAGSVSSQPAFNNSFIPAYSTRVQDGTGEESHSIGSSSSGLEVDEREEP